jgi:hypothetical protein
MIEQEWRNEPNELEFEYKGYKCLILRGPVGALNGYVFIPDGHKLYGKLYNDQMNENFDVHGGLTYSGNLKGQDKWAIGFDCAHLGDIAPLSLDREWFYKDKLDKATDEEKDKASQIFDALEILYKIYPTSCNTNIDTYKNIDFVKKECEKLVDQLVEYKA